MFTKKKSILSTIIVSSLLILLLLLFNLAVNYFTTKSITKNVVNVDRERVWTQNILELERNVTKLQLAVSNYIQTGNNAQILKVKKLIFEIGFEINKLTESFSNSSKLNKMQNYLKDFEAQFNLVVEEKKIRNKLIKETLPYKKQVIIDKLQSISKKSLRDINYYYTLIDKNIDQFILEGEGIYVSKTNKAFKDFIEEIKTKKIKLDLKDINSYKKTFIRIVQATRSYLYIKNVVMAGQAYEFIYIAGELKDDALKRIEKTSSETLLKLDNTTKLGFILLAIGIVVTIIAIYFVIKNILKPIINITNTLSLLSQNKDVPNISEIDREDEIGQMAKAAQKFSESNSKTKQLLDESIILTNELKETNEELDNFAYIASHDLKSPLLNINNLCLWIEEESLSILPKDSAKYLELMKNRIAKMEQLLNDMLNYSKISKREVEISEIPVNELIKSLYNLIDYKNYEIILDDSLSVIKTDKLALQQVFLNLIYNAIKYNDKDKAIIKISSEKLDNNFYKFSVTDNGPGIEEQYFEKIFKMYQRIRVDLDGTGMGLAIVKKNVSRKGGEIKVFSEISKGTTFEFTWPDEVFIK